MRKEFTQAFQPKVDLLNAIYSSGISGVKSIGYAIGQLWDFCIDSYVMGIKQDPVTIHSNMV